MSSPFRTTISLAALTLFASCKPTSPPAPPPPHLTYQFKTGQTLIYAITIETHFLDSTQTRTGNSFYKVESIDPTTNAATLTNSADLSIQQTLSNAATSASSPSATTITRRLVIDPSGTSIPQNDDKQPALGRLAEFIIQPFPTTAASHWTTHRTIQITDQTRNSWHLLPSTPSASYAAQEITDYTLGKPDGMLFPIQKDQTLNTDANTPPAASFAQSAHGQIIFDTATGLVTSVSVNYDTTAIQNTITLHIPTTFTARLLTPDQTNDLLSQQKADALLAQQKAADLLAQQKATDLLAQQKAVDLLATKSCSHSCATASRRPPQKT